MKLAITIEYNSGEQATYVAQPPEWAKWEKQTGYTIMQYKEKTGMWDLLYLAYQVLKRESGNKPVKPFEAWMETVADVIVGDADPKATAQEA
jgi:hypothetical protein